MERKVKYNCEFKLRCVEEVLKRHNSVKGTARANKIAESNLTCWINRYNEFGIEGLLSRQKNKVYTADFKLKVIQTIENKSISLNEACLIFKIPAQSTIISWQRKYAKDDLAGLELKSRGRPAVMNFKRKQRKTDKPLTREEELLKELEYLRAENEILKKFNALVQAEQANHNKKLKP
jgi:transposase